MLRSLQFIVLILALVSFGFSNDKIESLQNQGIFDDAGVELVHVPSGTFEMGINDDELKKICNENFGEPDCLSGEELAITASY